MKKSKYTIFLVILSIVTLLFSAGCTGKEPMSSVDDTQPVIIEQPSEVVSEVVSEVPSEPESEPEPQVDPNVERSMQFLEVSEEWLRDTSDPDCCLAFERDGKLYSLCYKVPKNNRNLTGLGFSDDDYASVYCVGDAWEDNIVMDSDFILPVLDANDRLLWFGDTSIKEFSFSPLVLYGYTIPAITDTPNNESLTIVGDYDVFKNYTFIGHYKTRGFGLFDGNGNSCSDIRKLNKGETYTAKWTDGEEKELTVDATCMYYKGEENEVIKIAPQQTDDVSVLEIDLSSLPSGVYLSYDAGGMFVIP